MYMCFLNFVLQFSHNCFKTLKAMTRKSKIFKPEFDDDDGDNDNDIPKQI